MKKNFYSHLILHNIYQQDKRKCETLFLTFRVPFSFMCFSLDLDIMETKKRYCFDSWQWFSRPGKIKGKRKALREKSPFHCM